MASDPRQRREISMQEFVLSRWWELWDDEAPAGEDHDPLDGLEKTTLLVFEPDEFTVNLYMDREYDDWLILLIATALAKQDALTAE